MTNENDHLNSIDVEVPVSVAYNQWTQFETFPKFMENVDSVTQLEDDQVHWKIKMAGVSKEFNTRITEQSPDQRIAWTTETGPAHGGVVTFHKLSDNETRVTLQMDYEPEGFLENVADKVGFVSSRISGDMENFKKFIESQDEADGAWRGSIQT